MHEILPVEEFIKSPGHLIDVRSPGEFLQGSIPGASNLPLFTDQERAEVGTLYKQVSPESAFLRGLEISGPKLSRFVSEAHKHKSPLRVFCFRGGQRSGSMAWLFRSAGIQTTTLQGGYKAFRRDILELFSQKLDLRVIGGLSGSGKTALLQQLKLEGHQTIDLEALAGHCGSAFGLLGKCKQPTSESFENQLGFILAHLDPSKPIWIEDESRMIGSCKIPDALYSQISGAPLLFIESPLEERLKCLLRDYGSIPKQELISATIVLKKRLGEVRTKEIIAYIEEGDLSKAATLLLSYYDQTYLFSISKNKRKILPFKDATCHSFKNSSPL